MKLQKIKSLNLDQEVKMISQSVKNNEEIFIRKNLPEPVPDPESEVFDEEFCDPN